MKKFILLLVLFVFNVSLSAQETNTSYYARLQKGENKEIISELSVKITAEPNEELLFILGEAYKNQFDYINALNSYLKILTLNPENNLVKEKISDIYMILGQYADASGLLRTLYSADSTNSRIGFKLCTSLQNTGRTGDAISLLRKLYTKNVYNYNTAKTLGDYYRITGNLDSSLYFYERADFLNGKNSASKLALSYVLYDMEDYNSAKIYVSRVVEMDSSSISARKQLAYCNFKLEEHAEAARDFKYIIEQGDTTMRNYLAIGICHYLTGKFSDALPYLEKGFVKDPKNHELLFYLGATHNQLNESNEAILFFKIALALLEPDTKVLYVINNQMGTAYARMGKYEDAYTHFSTALMSNPNDLKLLYDMAMAKYEIKNEKSLGMALAHLKEYLLGLEKKGTTLSKDEVYLKTRSEWYVNKITEDLFMMEKPK